MKKILISCGWILLLLPLVTIAGTKTLCNSLSPSRNSVTLKEIAPFTSITLSGLIKVDVSFGDEESIRIEGKDGVEKQVSAKVKGKTLLIRYKAPLGMYLPESIPTVYVTAKTLTSLICSGSGDIKVNGIIKESKLTVVNNGSGSVSFIASVDQLKSTISGSGTIHAAGSASDASILLSGSGQFAGKELKTQTVQATLSGNGNVYIHANKRLDGNISGGGKIYYTGAAEAFERKLGEGKIVHMD